MWAPPKIAEAWTVRSRQARDSKQVRSGVREGAARWRDGHMVQRWTATRMLNAEQIPLSEALHRHAHRPTASQTETVGAAALSSDQIAIHVPRDSGNPRSHTEPLLVAVVPPP